MHDKNTSQTHDCGCGCSDCACGKRNRFFRGKRMKAGDFEIEQAYGIERRRIINRSVFGWGVVSGFKMSEGPSDVGAGFALDRHGREIVLAEAAKPGPANTFVIAGGASGCRTLGLDTLEQGRLYVLSVHYAERRFGDANLSGGCGCDKPEQNYVCETAVFSLDPSCRECPCGEEPCHRPCECGVGDACGEAIHELRPRPLEPKHPQLPEVPGEHPHPGKQPIDRALQYLREEGRIPTPEMVGHEPLHELQPLVSRSRGPHACVCHWLMEEEVDCDRPAMCDWNGYAIDPADGVPLACVRVKAVEDPCSPLDIEVVDACGPRRFVKSNDLLYDFIRGCDLTHLEWVSWWPWHRYRRPMPWDLFAKFFSSSDGATEFVVRFSGPVIRDTIRFDSVVMRALLIDQATDWRLMRTVPIVALDLTPSQPHTLPSHLTDQIRFIVAKQWIDDEIVKDRPSLLSENTFEIEIQIFGDGILNCHRQPADLDAVGVQAFPSGDGWPGGTYRSCFRVEPKPRSGKRESAA